MKRKENSKIRKPDPVNIQLNIFLWPYPIVYHAFNELKTTNITGIWYLPSPLYAFTCIKYEVVLIPHTSHLHIIKRRKKMPVYSIYIRILHIA